MHIFRYTFLEFHAGVAELVDALDLGSSAARRGGSSPSIRTKIFTVYKTNLNKIYHEYKKTKRC